MNTMKQFRGWEYSKQGDYHRNLNLQWQYAPTYLRKMHYVRMLIDKLPHSFRILDAACGEGVIVEEYQKKGRDIYGMDINYESTYVLRGDLRQLPYADKSFDAVLLLDALEHVSPPHQLSVLTEIARVLRRSGLFILSVPNLAHLSSRIRFLRHGTFDRTDAEQNHPGERPLTEYRNMLIEAGFHIDETAGITLTVPVLYKRLICRWPHKFRWLHDLLEPIAMKFPRYAMISMIACRHAQELSINGLVDVKKRKHIAAAVHYPGLFFLFTHLSQRECIALYELAHRLEDRPVVVEIGSYLGGSTCFLAGGIRHKRGTVYAIDTWNNDGMSEGKRNTLKDFKNNIRPLKEFIIPKVGLSTTIAREFNQQIDMLFFDGDHSYEGLCQDVSAWLPKLRKNGIVAFHDYSWAEGVKRVIAEKIKPCQVEHEHILENLYWTKVDTNKLRN